MINIVVDKEKVKKQVLKAKEVFKQIPEEVKNLKVFEIIYYSDQKDSEECVDEAIDLLKDNKNLKKEVQAGLFNFMQNWVEEVEKEVGK